MDSPDWSGERGGLDIHCSAQRSSTNLWISFHAGAKFVTPLVPVPRHLYLVRGGSWFFGEEIQLFLGIVAARLEDQRPVLHHPAFCVLCLGMLSSGSGVDS